MSIRCYNNSRLATHDSGPWHINCASNPLKSPKWLTLHVAMIHVHSMQTCMHGYRPDVCVSMVLRLHPNFPAIQSLLVSEFFFVVYKIFMSQRRGIHVNSKLLTQDMIDPPKIITTTDRLTQDKKQWVVQTHDCTTSCMYDHLALWLTMEFSLWSINHVCTVVSDSWLACWN